MGSLDRRSPWDLKLVKLCVELCQGVSSNTKGHRKKGLTGRAAIGSIVSNFHVGTTYMSTMWTSFPYIDKNYISTIENWIIQQQYFTVRKILLEKKKG